MQLLLGLVWRLSWWLKFLLVDFHLFLFRGYDGHGRMNPHVPLQVGLLEIGLGTVGTLERTLAYMKAVMACQIGFLFERFGTVITLMWA